VEALLGPAAFAGGAAHWIFILPGFNAGEQKENALPSSPYPLYKQHSETTDFAAEPLRSVVKASGMSAHQEEDRLECRALAAHFLYSKDQTAVLGYLATIAAQTSFLTFAAWGPLGPCTMSNSTRSFSLSVR